MFHQVKKPHGKARLAGLLLRAQQVQGYYECGPPLLSLENRGIIECLLVVFTQQLENVATTLSYCTFDKAIPIVIILLQFQLLILME